MLNELAAVRGRSDEDFLRRLQANPAIQRGSHEATCALLGLGRIAAEEGLGSAADLLAAWLWMRPHALRTEHQELVLEVYSACLGEGWCDATTFAKRVLTYDPTFNEIALVGAEAMLANDIVDWLEWGQAHTPQATWMGELARLLPRLVTLGDFESPTTRERSIQAVVDFGGLPREEVERTFAELHESLRN